MIFSHRRPGRPRRQDAGETEPDGAECALPQGLAALRQVLVQPARQEDPQEGRARREGQAGKVALILDFLRSKTIDPKD